MRNKKEIAKMMLKTLLISGAIIIASTSPCFAAKIVPALMRDFKYILKNKKKKKSAYNVFYRLKSQGLIEIQYKGKQMHISLTEEGKKKAGKFQINDLKIKKTKKWDKKWRILIFDIKDEEKIKREALRGKIKEWGFYQLQKSVWVLPYDFKREIAILRGFFNLNSDEMKIISAYEIEDDKKIKSFFKLAGTPRL